METPAGSAMGALAPAPGMSRGRSGFSGKRRDDAGAADLGWRSGEWRVRGAILEGSNQSRARFVGIGPGIAVRIVFRAK